jgi:putative thiamine transport system ATP-binding protein
MNPATLHLQDACLRLGTRILIPPTSLSIPPGEVITLMGESGSGKSSLLAWLCGTLPRAFTASGRILAGNLDLTHLPPERRHLGILFQDDLLFPHLSVGDNLAFALPAAIRPRADRRLRVEQALAEAGLHGFADRDPATLSGGQRARVAVMRVLLSQPRALLLDEPFSKLDASTRQRFREFVFDHLRQLRLPTLLVTHDRADADAAGGRVIELPPAEPDRR